MLRPYIRLSLVVVGTLAVIALSGCASSSQTALAPVDPQSTYVAELGDANPGKAIVTFYRPGKFAGSMLNTSVFIDGDEVADLDNGTYIVTALEPGTHVFHSDEASNAVDLTVEADSEYYFKIGIQAGLFKGHGVLELMTEEQGRSQFEHIRNELHPADDVRIPELVVSH